MIFLSPETSSRFRLCGADQLLSTELAAKIIAGARTEKYRWQRICKLARRVAHLAERGAATEGLVIREVLATMAARRGAEIHGDRSCLSR